jgi:hypothetical protein
MSAFFDYVRGVTDKLPDGYSEKGMRLYRHHVYLGASQLLTATYPQLKEKLLDSEWEALMVDFVKKTKWTSHIYAELIIDFKKYLSDNA